MSNDSKIKSDELDELFGCILSLNNVDECYQFFEDICTVNELHSISQRLQVAKLLYQKKTYVEVEKATKASTATISRINKFVNYGSNGYQLALDRMNEKKNGK